MAAGPCPAGGPPPGPHNFFRGGPLAVYDGETQAALAALNGHIDTVLAAEVWQAAAEATWQGRPVWRLTTIHRTPRSPLA